MIDDCLLGFRQDAFTLDVLEVPQGSGSGFVWDKKGHIVTNYHVIRGASDLRFAFCLSLVPFTFISNATSDTLLLSFCLSILDRLGFKGNCELLVAFMIHVLKFALRNIHYYRLKLGEVTLNDY